MALTSYDNAFVTNDDDKRTLAANTAAWNATSDPNEKARLAASSESIRNKYGYSGGSDGSTFTALKNNAGYAVNPAIAGITGGDTSNYANLYQNQANSSIAQARNNYLKNITNMANTYNQGRADLLKTYADTQSQFERNVRDTYRDAYTANAIAQQNAANRGLTSSALGTAMGTSALVNAANKVSDLKSDRDTNLSNINTQLDRLAADYNIDRDTALNALYNTEWQSNSDAAANYWQAMADVNQTEANARNAYINAAYNAGANALLSDKEFANQISEAQINADLQLKLAEMNNALALQTSGTFEQQAELQKALAQIQASS